MTAYANIGGIALLFFILTALATSEVDNPSTEDAMSIRSTLMILLSVVAFGFAGEYALAKSVDALTSFGIALTAGVAIGGPYALVRVVTRKRNPRLEADAINTTTEAS